MFRIERNSETGKWFLTWGGARWPQTELDTRELAEGRLRRMKNRYPNRSFQPLFDCVPTKAKVGWRWTLGEESEVIVTQRKSDAKSVLRYKLQRKSLPKGMTWEVAYDV